MCSYEHIDVAGRAGAARLRRPAEPRARADGQRHRRRDRQVAFRDGPHGPEGRDLGLIEVRAAVADPIDVDLSTRLAQSYGLRSALVVATRSTGDAEVREAIAQVTARFIAESVEEDDMLGFAPGRT